MRAMKGSLISWPGWLFAWALPAVAEEFNSTGFVSCPCVDPDIAAQIERVRNYTSMWSCDAVLDEVANAIGKYLPAYVNGEFYYYPLDYGSSWCRPWDQYLHPECADSDGHPLPTTPAWCTLSWCYVDANCGLPKIASEFAPFTGNMFYSYSTCESPDSTRGGGFMKILGSNRIRVHPLSEPPWVYPDRAADDPIGRGVIWDLYTAIWKETGASEVRSDLAPHEGTRWDACVNEVARGTLDLCYGTFWETPERRELVSFVSPLMVDSFYLVVKKADKRLGFLGKILKPFSPFTLAMWASLFGVVSVFGFAIFWLDEISERGCPYTWDALRDDWRACLQSQYLGCLGLISGGPAHEPRTLGAKIVQLVFGVVIVLVIAGYTANLASILVEERAAQGTFESVDKLLDHGHKVCLWSVVHKSFLESIPRGVNSVVLTSSTEEAFEKLDAGECKGIVNGEGENDRVLRSGEHCDKMQVGQAVFSLMLTQPVNHKYADALSWLTLRFRSILLEGKAKYQTIDSCASQRAATTRSDQLGVTDFVGVFGIAGIGIVLAIFVQTCRTTGEHVAETASESFRLSIGGDPEREQHEENTSSGGGLGHSDQDLVTDPANVSCGHDGGPQDSQEPDIEAPISSSSDSCSNEEVTQGAQQDHEGDHRDQAQPAIVGKAVQEFTQGAQQDLAVSRMLIIEDEEVGVVRPAASCCCLTHAA